jgi:hypothetical protein
MAIGRSQSRQQKHSPDNEAATQQPAQPPGETRKQQYQREYHRTHRVRLAVLRRARYKKNPTPLLASTRRWVAKNREWKRQYQKEWYQKNRERLRVKHREYDLAHREHDNARHRAAYKRKKEAKLRAILDELSV